MSMQLTGEAEAASTESSTTLELNPFVALQTSLPPSSSSSDATYVECTLCCPDSGKEMGHKGRHRLFPPSSSTPSSPASPSSSSSSSSSVSGLSPPAAIAEKEEAEAKEKIEQDKSQTEKTPNVIEKEQEPKNKKQRTEQVAKEDSDADNDLETLESLREQYRTKFGCFPRGDYGQKRKWLKRKLSSSEEEKNLSTDSSSRTSLSSSNNKRRKISTSTLTTSVSATLEKQNSAASTYLNPLNQMCVLGGYSNALDSVGAITRVVDAVLKSSNTTDGKYSNGVVVVSNDGHECGRWGASNFDALGANISFPSPILNSIACAAVHAQNSLGGESSAVVCCVSLSKRASLNESGTQQIVKSLRGIEYLDTGELRSGEDVLAGADGGEDASVILETLKSINPSFIVVRGGKELSCLGEIVKYADMSSTCVGLIVIMHSLSFQYPKEMSSTVDVALRTLRRDL